MDKANKIKMDKANKIKMDLNGKADKMCMRTMQNNKNPFFMHPQSRGSKTQWHQRHNTPVVAQQLLGSIFDDRPMQWGNNAHLQPSSR